MGMYTEIYVNVDLKKDTPPDVIDVLRAIVEGDYANTVLSAYPDRWPMLFSDGSYYTPLTCASSLTYDGIHNGHSLIGKGDIKNYEREIEAFFDFIAPHVDDNVGDTVFIGYSRYEEDTMPTLYFTDGRGGVIRHTPPAPTAVQEAYERRD
jgi:hypothetical protein